MYIHGSHDGHAVPSSRMLSCSELHSWQMCLVVAFWSPQKSEIWLSEHGWISLSTLETILWSLSSVGFPRSRMVSRRNSVPAWDVRSEFLINCIIRLGSSNSVQSIIIGISDCSLIRRSVRPSDLLRGWMVCSVIKSSGDKLLASLRRVWKRLASGYLVRILPR